MQSSSPLSWNEYDPVLTVALKLLISNRGLSKSNIQYCGSHRSLRNDFSSLNDVKKNWGNDGTGLSEISILSPSLRYRFLGGSTTKHSSYTSCKNNKQKQHNYELIILCPSTSNTKMITMNTNSSFVVYQLALPINYKRVHHIGNRCGFFCQWNIRILLWQSVLLRDFA